MSRPPVEPRDLDIIGGRTPPPHTQAPDWVALSGVSPEAHSLHVKLAMHVNRDRGDSIVWPGTDSLAKLMNVSRGDKVTNRLQELEAIGALDIRRVGMPRRNIYVVHTMPPPGYAGPLKLKEWYKANRAELDAGKAEAKVKRDARRAKAKGQVSPVTPKTGEQAVTPKTGEQVTPDRGEPVTPKRGREQDLKEQDEKNTPLPPAVDSPDVVPAARTGEGEKSDDNTGDMLAAALEQAHALKPGWRPDAMRAAMLAEISGGRSAAAVARAIVELAKDPRSDGPGRLKVAGPWWNADAGAVVEGPVRYIDRDASRCRTHRGEPADACGKCKAEQFVPDYDRERAKRAAPTDGAAARAAIRQATAAGAAKYKQPARRGPVQPVTADRRSSALAALTEAAERLTRAHEMPTGDQEPVRELANVAAS